MQGAFDAIDFVAIAIKRALHPFIAVMHKAINGNLLNLNIALRLSNDK